MNINGKEYTEITLDLQRKAPKITYVPSREELEDLYRRYPDFFLGAVWRALDVNPSLRTFLGIEMGASVDDHFTPAPILLRKLAKTLPEVFADGVEKLLDLSSGLRQYVWREVSLIAIQTELREKMVSIWLATPTKIAFDGPSPSVDKSGKITFSSES